MTTNIWNDGICKKCGFIVIETPDDFGRKDYMNMCTNGSCENHYWHNIFDDEELDYYYHNKE